MIMKSRALKSTRLSNSPGLRATISRNNSEHLIETPLFNKKQTSNGRNAIDEANLPERKRKRWTLVMWPKQEEKRVKDWSCNPSAEVVQAGRESKPETRHGAKERSKNLIALESTGQQGADGRSIGRVESKLVERSIGRVESKLVEWYDHQNHAAPENTRRGDKSSTRTFPIRDWDARRKDSETRKEKRTSI